MGIDKCDKYVQVPKYHTNDDSTNPKESYCWWQDWTQESNHWLNNMLSVSPDLPSRLDITVTSSPNL